MTWLSRALHEALRALITTGAPDKLELRAAAYEFTEPGVLAAFPKTAAGADVKIIYYDKPDDPESTLNEAAMRKPGSTPAMLIAPPSPGHRAHKKFIVRATRDAAGQQVQCPVASS